MTAALPLLAPLLALDEIEQLELTVDAGLRAALDALTALRERDVHTDPRLRPVARVRAGPLRRRPRSTAAAGRQAPGLGGFDVHPDGQATARAAGARPVRCARRGCRHGAERPRRARPRHPAGTPARQRPAAAATGHVWEQGGRVAAPRPGRKAEGIRDGLTLVELAKAAGWTEGKASGALSDVRHRGLAVRLEERRAGQRVDVVPAVS